MKSKKFAMLKERYDHEWITEETLRGWVQLNDRAPGRGITAAEFEEITGKSYEEETET